MKKKLTFKWRFYNRKDGTGDFVAFLNRETSTQIMKNCDERHQLKFKDFNEKTYVIKRFSPSDNKKFSHRFDLAVKSFFISGARKSFRGAVWLWEAGIPTVKPVAFSSIGKGFSQVSYFIYEAIIADQDINTLMDSMNDDDSRKNVLIGQMAKITRVVHNAGYRHTDIVGHNFLVDNADKNRPKVYLIDTDKTEKTFITAKIPFLKMFFDMRCLRRLRIDNDSIRHFLKVYHGRELKNSDLWIFEFWLSGGFNPKKRSNLKKRLPQRLRNIARESI